MISNTSGVPVLNSGRRRQHFGRTIGGDGSDESVTPVADLGSGSARDLGLAHGRILRDRVRSTAAVVRELQPVALHDEVPSQWRVLAPDLVVEMEGIAEASDLPLADIVAINAFQHGPSCGSIDCELCASASAPGSGEQRHSLLAACTAGGLGFPVALRSSCVTIRGTLVDHDHGDDAAPFAYFALPGAVGGIGLGRHVGLVAVPRPAGDSYCAGCLSLAMLDRLLLQCSCMSQARELYRRLEAPAVSVQALIMDTTGAACSLGEPHVTSTAAGTMDAESVMANLCESCGAANVSSVVAVDVRGGLLYVATGAVSDNAHDSPAKADGIVPILRVRVWRCVVYVCAASTALACLVRSCGGDACVCIVTPELM